MAVIYIDIAKGRAREALIPLFWLGPLVGFVPNRLYGGLINVRGILFFARRKLFTHKSRCAPILGYAIAVYNIYR